MSNLFSRPRTFAFLLAAIVLGVAGLTWSFMPGLSGQEKQPGSAEAEVLVWITTRSAGANSLNGRPPEGINYRIQRAVLTSQMVLERAIKKRDLASLKSLTKVADPVAAIRAGLSVLRDPDSGDAFVLALTYRGPSADDGVKILAAVIESYQETLDIAYQGANDETADYLTKNRDLLSKDLAESEDRYMRFRQQEPLLWKFRSDIFTERLATLERKKTELLIRQIELRTDLKQAEEHADRPSFQVKVHEWATKTGFDKLPKAVQDQGQVAVFKDHLKEKMEGLIASEAALNQLIEIEQIKHLQREKSEIKENQLRTEVERVRQLYDLTIKRLGEFNLARDSGGFTVRMISAPKAR